MKSVLTYIIAFSTVLASGAQAAAKDHANVILVDAILQSVRQIQIQSSDSAVGELRLSRPFRHDFKVRRILAGRAPEGRLTLTFERQSWPATGFAYFLIVERTDNGLVTVWWRIASLGLCVDPTTAAKYDLTDSIRKLQSIYPCTDQPWNYVR